MTLTNLYMMKSADVYSPQDAMPKGDANINLHYVHRTKGLPSSKTYTRQIEQTPEERRNDTNLTR